MENTNIPLLDKHRSRKVRRQYFNVLLMVSAAVALMLFAAQAAAGEWWGDPDDIWYLVGVLIVVVFPLMALSALNRRFFGRVVCYLTNDGIYNANPGEASKDDLDDEDDIGEDPEDDDHDHEEEDENKPEHFIPWQMIQSMTFTPTCVLRTMHYEYAYVTVLIRDGETEYEQNIISAPLHLLRQARKYNRRIKTAINKGYLYLYVGGPVLLGVLFGVLVRLGIL